jgi:hypothetical protein
VKRWQMSIGERSVLLHIAACDDRYNETTDAVGAGFSEHCSHRARINSSLVASFDVTGAWKDGQRFDFKVAAARRQRSTVDLGS